MAFLFAVIAFLFPIGVYCFILASINQRAKPLMANGRWDAVGLLFACSGFFLGTIPALITDLYARFAGVVLSSAIADLWLTLWLAYFLLLLAGSIGMMMWRSHKTMIYHVDAEIFARVLERAFETLGLSVRMDKERMILTPMKRIEPMEGTAFAERPGATNRGPDDRRHAEVEVESFPAMCHVTLHWDNYMPAVRREIERELRKDLPLATPAENPAAGWFLGICGLIFGALTMIALTIVFMIWFSRR